MGNAEIHLYWPEEDFAVKREPQANKKFFGAAVFQKCCRGVGEQPTFAEQIRFCNKLFLLQLHFLKLVHSQFDWFYETSCKFGQGNGAIAASWQAKAGVEPPFAGRWKLFSQRIDSLHLFHWSRCNFCAVFHVKQLLLWKRTVQKYEPQATEKFFGAAVFQKCCRGVGE